MKGNFFQISNDESNQDTDNEESQAEPETIAIEDQTAHEISISRQETSATEKKYKKRKLNNGRAPAVNKKNTVEKAYELLAKPDDEYDVMGQSVAIKLRKMNEKQALYCEKVINEALYKGMMEQLNEQSCVTTTSQLQNNENLPLSGTTAHHSYPQDYCQDFQNQQNYYNPPNNKNYSITNAAETQTFVRLEPSRSETPFFNINSILSQNNRNT